MLTIELRFPAHRYHATPWNHHVNEGVVEWPPSPWRLLRALVATWHLKAREEAGEAEIRTLVEKLAAELPEYVLPRGTPPHTRHYMPLYKVGETTKIFDTFIHVAEADPMRIRWPSVALSDDTRDLLEMLLICMGYLGRAESWVEAQLIHDGEADDALSYTTRPLDAGERPAGGQELVRVLAPLALEDFSAWRVRVLETLLERRLGEKRKKAEAKNRDPDNEKLMPADKKKVDETLPVDLLRALECDTGDLRKRGWSAVPGTRWVDYVRPHDALELAPAHTPRRVHARLPTVARFAVASQVPPRLTEVVSVAERTRTALMSRSGGLPVFSGKDDDGNPRSDHGHAFILPEANGEHGRITHVTLYAKMGFDTQARRAMDELRKVWGRNRHDLQLVLIGVGDPQDFAGIDLARGHCPLLVESDTWVSRTPFVPTRHPKKKSDATGLQVGSPEHDLRRLLEEAAFPEPAHVDPLRQTTLGGKETRWLSFKTKRASGEGRRGPVSGIGFRIVFPRSVRGPIAVGYGAHFGLGVFWPAEMNQ